MIIKDVVSLAKHSELSGIAVKNDMDAVVAFINLGMLELYKRFPIKVEEHVVNLEAMKVYYDMPSDFMYPTEAWGEVDRDSNVDNPIAINDEDAEQSIFFNDWNTVQVPSTVIGDFISIMYVAKPSSITVVQAEDGVSELDLPDALINCLLSYVGYRGYLGVRSDSQSENNAHWSRFERNCAEALKLGVGSPAESMNMSTRIDERGFA